MEYFCAVTSSRKCIVQLIADCFGIANLIRVHTSLHTFLLLPHLLFLLPHPTNQGIRSQHKVLLTGTPLQNNITELFMLLHFLDHSKFASVEDFEAQFSEIGQEEQVGVC